MDKPKCRTCPFYDPCDSVDCDVEADYEHGNCSYYPPTREESVTYVPDQPNQNIDDFPPAQWTRTKKQRPTVGADDVGCFAHPEQMTRVH